MVYYSRKLSYINEIFHARFDLKRSSTRHEKTGVTYLVFRVTLHSFVCEVQAPIASHISGQLGAIIMVWFAFYELTECVSVFVCV